MEPTAVQIHLNAAPYFNHIFKHLQMKQDQLINGLNDEVDKALQREFEDKQQQKKHWIMRKNPSRSRHNTENTAIFE